MKIVRALERDAEPKVLFPRLNFNQRSEFVKEFEKWRAENYSNIQAALNKADMFHLIFQQAKYSGKYKSNQLELIQRKVCN